MVKPYRLYHLRPQRLLLLALLSLLGPWCTPHTLVWAAAPSPAYQQALQAYRQGQYAQATAQFKILALQYPEDTRLPYYLALLAVRQNQLQQAEAYYQQVLLLEPQGPVAPFAQKGLALLAMAKQQQEATQKAAQTAAKAAASNTPNGAPSLRELTGLQPTFGKSAHPPMPKPPVFGHAVDGTPNVTEPMDKPPAFATAEAPAKTTPMATEAPANEANMGRTPSTFKEGSQTTAVASTPSSATPAATSATPALPADAAALAQQQQQQLMQQMMMMQMMSSMGGGGNNSNSNPMAMMAPLLMMQQQQQATTGGAAAGVGALPTSPFGGIDPKMLGDMMSQSMLNNMDLLGGGKNGDNDR